jgi:hydrogenase maturation factor HypE
MAKQTYGDKDQNSFKEMKNNLKSFRTESKQKQRNSIRQSSRIGRDGASSSGSQTSG